MSLPWFRMYAEFAGDPVVQSISFDDQRHFIVLLCLKCSGLLDREVPADRREAIIARGLGLDPSTSAEVKRRLHEVNLIDKQWQPCSWEKRQFNERRGVAVSSPEGRAYIYFIGSENGDRVKIGYSKNPWARLKDFQSSTTEQLRVIATVATTENSESHVHKLFSELRISGEWHTRNDELNNVIIEIQEKRIRFDYDVANYVAQLRCTTTDTEQNRTDTEDKYHTALNARKFTDADLNSANRMFALIKIINPKHKKPNLNNWANEIRLLRERDQRTDDEIRSLFEWANEHQFWKTNILSPAALRKQWDKLAIQMGIGIGKYGTYQKHDKPSLAERATDARKRFERQQDSVAKHEIDGALVGTNEPHVPE